jgi:hypothetical protein
MSMDCGPTLQKPGSTVTVLKVIASTVVLIPFFTGSHILALPPRRLSNLPAGQTHSLAVVEFLLSVTEFFNTSSQREQLCTP